jgi:DNA repair protein SbcD/Mre11
MRILHTADWHLGARLGVHDRTDELFAQAERVLRLAEDHSADVLLVAGDLFDHRTQPALTKRLADLIGPYIRRGLHVVLVPGNHDNRDHFRMMHALLTLEQGQRGHFHVVQSWELLCIEGVQFAAIPYPIAEMLLPFRGEVTGTTERNVALSVAYANLVRGVAAKLDPRFPAVFVAHITIAGVTTPSERELTYDDDIRLGTQDLPLTGNLAYIALGHIHQQQQIGHPVPCYYSGSIDRMNLGERNDQKGVLLVDVPTSGPADVKLLPLEAMPFYDIHVDASELEALPDRYKDLERAFVRIEIATESAANLVALQRRARELCPRCLEVRFSGAGAVPAPATAPSQAHDYRTTVLDYLREMCGQDPAFTELEQRTQSLFEEMSDVVAAH